MMSRIISAAAILVVVAAITTGSALAHAEPERAEPPIDGTVQGSPKTLEIWFSQEIATGTTVEVLGPDGTRVDMSDATIDLNDPERSHLLVTLIAGLPDGTYEVNWTSVSGEDGDQETGSFHFTVEGAGTPTASPVASPGVATPAATPAARVQGVEAKRSDIDERALLIALGVGALAALGIYGFWLLVKPKRHPYDRTDPKKKP